MLTELKHRLKKRCSKAYRVESSYDEYRRACIADPDGTALAEFTKVALSAGLTESMIGIMASNAVKRARDRIARQSRSVSLGHYVIGPSSDSATSSAGSGDSESISIDKRIICLRD